jgi:hypothetical protein
MGAGTWARPEDVVAGRLRHRPYLNGAGPQVVWGGQGRSSGGLVALVLLLVLAVAAVMRVGRRFTAPLLPAVRPRRGPTTGWRRGRVALDDEGRSGGVGRAARHLHLL